MKKTRKREVPDEILMGVLERLPLWQLDILELTGHNLEVHGPRK